MTAARLRYRDAELREWVYSAESSIHGTGLFAARSIARGEYIGTYWGPEAKRNGTYVLWVSDSVDESDWIGRSGRNLLRYLNHSADCNAEFDAFDLYALRDIAADEEITFYYGDEFDDSC